MLTPTSFAKVSTTIYKSFVCLHLDYGEVIYDQARNKSFQLKLKLCQYDAALAITGKIKGSSGEKLYCAHLFDKIQKNKSLF